MIFYTNKKKDIKLIPESYLVLVLSNSIKNITHPNYRRINLNPSIVYLDEYTIKELENKYMKKIKKEYSHHITSIVSGVFKNDQINSVVFVCDDSLYGFNFAKIICKYIQKRYGCKTYKFTNTVTREMRKESELCDEYIMRLTSDILKIPDKINV